MFSLFGSVVSDRLLYTRLRQLKRRLAELESEKEE